MEYKVLAVIRDRHGLTVRVGQKDGRGSWIDLPHPAGVALNPGDALLLSLRKIEPLSDEVQL